MSTFAVAYGQNGSNITLTVGGTKITKGSLCTIQLEGLENPSVTISENNEIIRQKINVGDDPMMSTPFKKVSSIEAIIQNGEVTRDSLVFDNNAPAATSVTMTYEFSYIRSLNVGDKVEILLPYWSSSGATATSSCGTADFTISEVGHNENFTISMEVTGSIVLPETLCSISVANLMNPSMVIPGNSSYFKKRFIAVEGGMPFDRISLSNAIFGASIYDDQFTFVSDPSINQKTAVAYTFKYTKNIDLEDLIIIRLPAWGIVNKFPVCSNASLGSQDKCEGATACYGNDIRCHEQRSDTSCTSLSVCGDGDDPCHCSWDSNVWVQPIEAQASLSCSGSTFETSFISANSHLLEVNLRVKTAPIMSHTKCKITISGLSNPKNTNVGNIESKISRVSPTNSTPFSAVSDIQPLLQNGIISQDSIAFSSNLPAAENVALTYFFEYSKTLKIGDKIMIRLPGWSGTNPVASIVNGCGNDCIYVPKFLGETVV